ncbi:citrate transporter [Pelistega indica]|uniref:Citrate transporter n=1 Tax=Pelistega indica TaxID=1414851 RepID=V8FX94_9BURK|nr:GntP family permease [Pelistega indica]ETD68328.1 citrate transporter [Pelistega indica]
MLLSTVAIIISLVLLMYLAYRGVSVLILAPVMAALAVLLSGDFAFMAPIYTETFMGGLGNYLLKFFPVFLLGALFGQLIADSGAASSIAHWFTRILGPKHAILTVVLACAALTYGGVSLFVVAFAIYPIAKVMFYKAGIPKRIIPGAIALGAFTFTMTSLPGTPAIQNAIPIPFYHTNVFAAPGLGIIGSLVMFVFGWMWLESRARKAKQAGEGYGDHNDGVEHENISEHNAMSVALAFSPLVLVIALNALFTYIIFPGMDFSAVTGKFANLVPSKNTGMWAIIIALIISCLWLIVIAWNRWEDLKNTINKGSMGSMLPAFNTASEVGYGAVIASLAGFAIIKNFVLGVAPGNPLISEAVAMSALAGITGSSSGGLSIALQTLGADYLRLATENNISPELLHRVAVIAAGGFDTLPHCGAIITLLSICGLNHRQSYLNIAAVTIVGPVLAVATVIILGTMFGSF